MAVGEREDDTLRPSRDGNVCTVVGRRGDPLVNSLVIMLLKTREWDVRLADLTRKDGLGDLGESWSKVKIVGTDLTVRSQVFEVIRGSSAVFLMDLSEPLLVHDSYNSYMSIVQGTKNVVNICKECKVKRLIYNSSAHVVFDGLHEIWNGNESLPYPYKFEDTLIDFKAQAESIVLIANGSEGLLTCTLRPSNTFGPKDVHFIKFLVNKAQTGVLKFIIGSGEPLADFTYVDNVSHAHILAEKALCSKASSVAGKPFFITNLEPMKIWEFIALTLQGLGYQRPFIHLPVKLALFFVMIMDWLCRKLCLERSAQSFFTMPMIHALSCTRTFDCSKAKNILGYSPIVSLKDGISLTTESFSDLVNKTLMCRDRDISIPSKAESFLGSNEVAEILLWRDEKKTFSYIVVLFFLYYWFLLSGRTWITSAAKLLQMVLVILFIHGRLPSSVFNFHIGKLSPSYFCISETSVKNIINPMANLWNQGVYILRSIAQGRDGRLFLKVCGSLYLLTLILRFSLNTLTGLGLVTIFTIFIVYEQHEAEMDRLLSISSAACTKLWIKANEKFAGILAKYIREF